MLDGCALCVEVDRHRIERRIATGYLDDVAVDLDDALRRLGAARAGGRPLSIGLLGNAAQVLPELARRGVAVDVATDQTSAHDALNGYVPPGLTLEQAAALRVGDPEEYLRRAGEGARLHVGALRALGAAGAEVFDYGNALRGLAAHHGDTDAFAYPGFVPAYLRDQFCEGRGPFRWVALSGDPADIAATDAAILELFGEQGREGFTADAWLDELAGALDGLLDATCASALDIFVEDVAFTNATAWAAIQWRRSCSVARRFTCGPMRRGGRRYADPNELAKAVAGAARDAGLDLVLLPAAYARAGWDGGDLAPRDAQRRFADPTVDAYLARVEELRSWADARPGARAGGSADRDRL